MITMKIRKRIVRKIYKALHPAIGEVWMLHRVIPENQRSNNLKQRELEVTPEYLERLILNYKKKGYEFVSMDKVYHRLQEMKGCKNISRFWCQKFVAVTLDDGYQDNFQYAYPLLKKYKIPFIIYVSTQFIDNKIEMWWYPGESLGISQKDLIEMDKDELCTIGAHTLTHLSLECASKQKQYDEIITSQIYLEQLLHHKVDHFSYPYGDYNADTIDILEHSEMKTSVLVSCGKVRCDRSMYQIPRIPIKQE